MATPAVLTMEDEITTRIHELLHSTDDHAAGEAARILFELAHFSNPFSDSNKSKIAAGGGVDALCKHLRSQSYEVRYQTCSALGELAFRCEENCLLVVNTPDALPALSDMLACNAGNNQEDAALVINNCASFCEETAEKIVRCAGLLESLKLLAVGRHVGAKNVSIGALNCLSRSQTVLQDLVQARVVDEALVPVLEEKGRGEKHEVRKARAMMALVNLTGALPLKPLTHLPPAPAMHSADEPPHQAAAGRRAELSSIVRVLGFALDGRKWVGVSFTPYSVLYPLSRLARAPASREGLVECGLVEMLLRLLGEWVEGGRKSQQALLLTLEILEALAADMLGPRPAHRQVLERLRTKSSLAALQVVAGRQRGEGEEAAAAAERVLRRASEGPLAWWMGQHSALGSRSLVLQLDEYVAGLVLDLAFLSPEDHADLCPCS